VRVGEMSDEHLHNVLRWIERRTDEHPRRAAWLKVLRAEAHKRSGMLVDGDPFRSVTFDGGIEAMADTGLEIDGGMTEEQAFSIARDERFGETETEQLDEWLLCEAFEARFDVKRCRALKAAALIVRAGIRR